MRTFTFNIPDPSPKLRSRWSELSSLQIIIMLKRRLDEEFAVRVSMSTKKHMSNKENNKQYKNLWYNTTGIVPTSVATDDKSKTFNNMIFYCSSFHNLSSLTCIFFIYSICIRSKWKNATYIQLIFSDRILLCVVLMVLLWKIHAFLFLFSSVKMNDVTDLTTYSLSIMLFLTKYT